MSLKFGLILSDGAAPSLPETVKYAALGEKYGFDSVWIPDHLTSLDGARMDCWTALAGIGGRTKKLLLSPGVTDVHVIHPAKLAQIVASLDELTSGRAMVALGAGEAMSTIPFGIEFEKAKARIRRVREYIEVLKLLWAATREKMAFYQGEFYRLEEAFITQKPTVKPHPPIYIGAIKSKALLKIVGEIANGWFPFILTPEMYNEYFKVIKDAAKGVGRNPNEIDTVAWVYTCISRDRETLRTATNEGKVNVYLFKGILSSLGYKERPTPDYTLMLAHKPFPNKKTLIEAVKDVPEEPVHKCMMIKESPRECIEFIDKFVKAGLKHIAIRPMVVPRGPTVGDIIKEVNKGIMPYFKEH